MKVRSDPFRFFDAVLRICGALSGAILVAIMLMVCVKVFLRYGLTYGWIGVDQISGMLLLYMTFIGAAWVLSREEHVTIDFLVTHLPDSLKRIFLIVSSVVCALVCFIVFVYGTKEVVYSIDKGVLVPAELEIPRALNLAAIPFGCLLLWIQFLRRAWLAFRSGDRSTPTS